MTQFKEGQSGNPNGRPVGALSRRTQLARLLEPHAEELIEALVKQAKAGDPNALKLCIERLIPKVTNESPTISLPAFDCAEGNSLTLFRKTLMHAVTQQEEISMDSLNVILELYGAINREELAARLDKNKEPYSWQK